MGHNMTNRIVFIKGDAAHKAFLEAFLYYKGIDSTYRDHWGNAKGYFIKASGGNTKRAIQFTSIMPGKKPKNAHSLNLKHKKIECQTRKTFNTLKLIHFFWPVDEWKHPVPSPEQHELRSPRVTSEPELTPPAPCWHSLAFLMTRSSWPSILWSRSLGRKPNELGTIQSRIWHQRLCQTPTDSVYQVA